MLYQLYKYFRTKSLITTDRRISYHNFWDGQSADEIWFTGFLRERGFLGHKPKTYYAFFSSLGNADLLRTDCLFHPFDSRRKRIYFNGENGHHPRFKEYEHNLLDHCSIDLSLGFDYTDDPRYIRFPLWILEMFPPNSNEQDIKNICHQLSHQHIADSRNRFCAIVSGTSTMLGTKSLEMRTDMVNRLNTIDTVDCAGKLLHNTDELKTKFNDNKAEFLKQYRFYICPENASVEGYVTEKLFHCIGSGCIPIYWGAGGNPEPDILNHDAILFWNPDGDNSALLQKIADLQRNPQQYKDFFEQPRLKDDAWQVVANYFAELEKRLHNLLR